jgi:beta-glucosidase
MVLLQNEGNLLPLDATDSGSLAIIGPNAERLSIQGGGSAHVEPHHLTSVSDAVRARVGDGTSVRFEPGCQINRRVPALRSNLTTPDGEPGVLVEYFDNPEFEREPAGHEVSRRMEYRWIGSSLPANITGQFSLRATSRFTPSESGTHRFTVASAGLSRLLLDGDLLIDNWTAQTRGQSYFGQGSSEVAAEFPMVAGDSHELVLEYQSPERAMVAGVVVGHQPPTREDALERAVALAAETDTVLVLVGSNDDWESEGHDRVSMDLPGRQDELIERIAAVNRRTIVAVNAGSPVAMPWAPKVAAVLQIWYPGQEGGEALTDVLFGGFAPGGRLPTTFPIQVEDSPAHLTYPGEAGKVLYGESVFVGYRGYDRRKTEVRFPFGHGLSYTSFEYGPLALDRDSIAPGEEVAVSLSVRNSGARAGSEVVQVYVSDVKSSLMRPEKELKGFTKVTLEPGEERVVRITLPPRAFEAWDPRVSRWVAVRGEFVVRAGASAGDLRCEATLTLG